MEKELRKCQNTLVEAGTGVILFAVWSVVKINLYFGLSTFDFEEVYHVAADFGLDEKMFLIIMVIVIAAILLWQLGIRTYIGLSAAAEGKGKTKGYGYLVWAAILVVTDIQINWQAFGVDRILAGEGISVNLITSLCMELASVYVLMELLISGIRVKRLRKKMNE